MNYDAEISRANPTCVLFLLDQSGSMAEPFGQQPGKAKKDGVADVINKFLYDLVIKCSRDAGIYEYLRVGVIGYGTAVRSALGGPLAGSVLQMIGAIATNPLRVEQRVRREDDGAGGVIERKVKFPVWVEPVAGGKTPMAEAMNLAHESIAAFIREKPDCFPPVVINITDGIPTSEPRPASEALRALKSSNGNVLLFNIHVSDKPDRPIEFPDAETNLPDKFAKLLYRLSSTLPAPFVTAAKSEGFQVTPQSRGFVFNGDLVSVARFISFGTRAAQDRPSPNG